MLQSYSDYIFVYKDKKYVSGHNEPRKFCQVWAQTRLKNPGPAHSSDLKTVIRARLGYVHLVFMHTLLLVKTEFFFSIFGNFDLIVLINYVYKA